MQLVSLVSSFFFFNDTATTEIYTLSLHDALPISALFDLGVVLLILGPVKAAVDEEKSFRVEFEPAKTHRPLTSVEPPTVGSPGVVLVSVPLARLAGRALGFMPKPTSEAFRL